MVRRQEYLEVFLDGVNRGLGMRELETALGEQKKAFEVEKDLALGRGNPQRKDIKEAGKLVEYCLRLARDLRFVDKVGPHMRLLEGGRRYLEAGKDDRRRYFAETHSDVYPHLSAIVLAISRLSGEEAVVPLMDKPPFKPEVGRYGLDVSQMVFDTVRDVATSLGLINWYVSGGGLERRQHLYLACKLNENDPGKYFVKIRSGGFWLYAVENVLNRGRFRDSLWRAYLSLVDNIPGSPVFYSQVRERVCADLRIRDDQFDRGVMTMVENDEFLRVVWSEGELPYQQNSASMLKSLPPKNEWGGYVVYLKIVRKVV
jgi:hypothetical protein